MNDFDPALLARTFELAARGVAAGAGGPFGALVARDGEIIAEGHNQVLLTDDPTAHAEVVAIRAACAALGSFQLAGCVLYASCEPCPMCLGAVYWARPDAVWFAATKDDAARAGFDDSFIYDELAVPPADRSIPFRRVELPEATAVFDRWIGKDDRTQY